MCVFYFFIDGGQVNSSSIEYKNNEEYKLTVTWEEPYETRGVINEYRLTLTNKSPGPCDSYDNRECSFDSVSVPVTEGELEYTFEDLQPAQEFEVTILAVTDVGAGNASVPVTVETAVTSKSPADNTIDLITNLFQSRIYTFIVCMFPMCEQHTPRVCRC